MTVLLKHQKFPQFGAAVTDRNHVVANLMLVVEDGVAVVEALSERLEAGQDDKVAARIVNDLMRECTSLSKGVEKLSRYFEDTNSALAPPKAPVIDKEKQSEFFEKLSAVFTNGVCKDCGGLLRDQQGSTRGLSALVNEEPDKSQRPSGYV